MTGGTVTDSTLNIVSQTSGQLVIDGIASTYSDVAAIDDRLSATNRVMSLGDGNDQLTLSDNGTTSDGQCPLSLVGGVTVDFASPSESFVLHSGVGDDTITLAGADSLLNHAITVFGGLGNDTLDGGDGTDQIAGGVGHNRGRSAGDLFIDPASEINEALIVLSKWLTGA